MSEQSAFAYAPEGSVLACADGPELLVYSGANDAPLWKQFCDGYLSAVGAWRDRVYSVDTDGHLHVWRALDGEGLEAWEVEPGARGLAVDEQGGLAVWREEGVTLIEANGAQRPLPDAQPTAVAMGAGQVAVGNQDGTLNIYDRASGEVVGQSALGEPIRSLAWRSLGHWAVASGAQIKLLSQDAAQVTWQQGLSGAAGPLAVSADGALLAVVVDDRQVQVYETGRGAAMGTIDYDRPIVDIVFGPGAWLGIGLENGDANRIELQTGQTTRTGTHPGRATQRWGFKANIHHDQLRGAIAAVRAGGAPLARHIPLQKGGPPVPGGLSCMQVLLIVFGLLLLCGCCSGLATLMWRMFLG